MIGKRSFTRNENWLESRRYAVSSLRQCAEASLLRPLTLGFFFAFRGLSALLLQVTETFFFKVQVNRLSEVFFSLFESLVFLFLLFPFFVGIFSLAMNVRKEKVSDVSTLFCFYRLEEYRYLLFRFAMRFFLRLGAISLLSSVIVLCYTQNRVELDLPALRGVYGVLTVLTLAAFALLAIRESLLLLSFLYLLTACPSDDLPSFRRFFLEAQALFSSCERDAFILFFSFSFWFVLGVFTGGFLLAFVAIPLLFLSFIHLFSKNYYCFREEKE